MNASSHSRLASLALLLGTLACQPPVTSLLDTDSETTTPTGDEASSDTDTNTETDTDTGTDEPDTCVSALDILVVLDNSGSMGEEQAAIAQALQAIIDPLELNGVDWRVGVTTTDNGNPWCPAGATTPEGGQLVASSCRSRSDDFLFNNGQIDVRELACNDVCGLESLDISPTTTEFDPQPSPRPWIEGIDGAYNVADPLAALRCMLPMGINGCGFESQLESGYLALTRARLPDEQSYGFLRSEASLLVLLISDEADCSYNKDFGAIFEAEGNKVFWSDPSASFPTSAVCWNAGVRCVGASGGYDSCDPVNKGIDGAEDVDDASAVLHPLSRYAQQLTELQQEKRALAPGATVRLALIAGAELDGSLSYADTDDVPFQTSFGIGPGCELSGPGVEAAQAVPPVRMRDVAALSGGRLSSICAQDYSQDLALAVAPFVEGCE